MTTHRRSLTVLAIVGLASLAQAGSLEPPGPPASSMKPIDVVEARAPISSLPFTISQSGSYYLTADLTASGSSNGITVLGSATYVTIDLNGYSLIGAGDPNIAGITINYQANATVRNGTVRGWANGIVSNGGPIIKMIDVTSKNNARNGFVLYAGGEVLDSVAMGNGEVGIYVFGSAIIRNSQAIQNTLSGIWVQQNGLVEDCLSEGNGSGGPTFDNQLRAGIAVQYASKVVGCRVHSNAGDGIYLGDWNHVIGNDATMNGQSGISSEFGHGNRIEANQLWNNSGYGISLLSNLNLLSRNTARGNTLGNFQIPFGNTAPIETGTVVNPASNVSF